MPYRSHRKHLSTLKFYKPHQRGMISSFDNPRMKMTIKSYSFKLAKIKPYDRAISYINVLHFPKYWLLTITDTSDYGHLWFHQDSIHFDPVCTERVLSVIIIIIQKDNNLTKILNHSWQDLIVLHIPCFLLLLPSLYVMRANVLSIIHDPSKA